MHKSLVGAVINSEATRRIPRGLRVLWGFIIRNVEEVFKLKYSDPGNQLCLENWDIGQTDGCGVRSLSCCQLHYHYHCHFIFIITPHILVSGDVLSSFVNSHSLSPSFKPAENFSLENQCNEPLAPSNSPETAESKDTKESRHWNWFTVVNKHVVLLMTGSELHGRCWPRGPLTRVVSGLMSLSVTGPVMRAEQSWAEGQVDRIIPGEGEVRHAPCPGPHYTNTSQYLRDPGEIVEEIFVAPGWECFSSSQEVIRMSEVRRGRALASRLVTRHHGDI